MFEEEKEMRGEWERRRKKRRRNDEDVKENERWQRVGHEKRVDMETGVTERERKYSYKSIKTASVSSSTINQRLQGMTAADGGRKEWKMERLMRG